MMSEERIESAPDEYTELETVIDEHMRSVYSNGLAIGATTVLGAVLEIARDGKKTYQEKVNDIIQFCINGLGKSKEGKDE